MLCDRIEGDYILIISDRLPDLLMFHWAPKVLNVELDAFSKSGAGGGAVAESSQIDLSQDVSLLLSAISQGSVRVRSAALGII